MRSHWYAVPSDLKSAHLGVEMPKSQVDFNKTPQRLAYLESIRGIAALQVLLLHILSAFFPMMVFWSRENNIQTIIHYSPLFVVYNGYASVYIFLC